MNRYLKLICKILAVFLTVQCIADELKYDSDDVKKIVVAKAKEAIAKNLTHRMFTEVTGVPVELYGAYMVNYEWLKKRALKHSDAREVIDAIEKLIESKQIALEDIKIRQGSSLRFESQYATANLKIGNEHWPVSYRVFKDLLYKTLVVKVSGLDKIRIETPGSAQEIKPLPFKQVDIKKLDKFKEEYYAACGLEKGEFETQWEHQNRTLEAKAQAYKNFRKNNIFGKVFEISCNIENSLTLKFDPNRKTLNCFPLFDVLTEFASQYLYISGSSASSFGDDAYPDIDFAGVEKNKPTYGDSLFYCTVPEAKQIKQGLGNTWNYNKLKLWLKFNPQTMHFHIVKIFILPGKKS